MNDHYKTESTDNNYVEPRFKQTASPSVLIEFNEYGVYRSLISLRGSSTGSDGIPSWFLTSFAHLLAEPITILYQRSLNLSYVPPEWRTSCITPVPKVTRPKEPNDFRPISITSVLCCILEKVVVRRYFYAILTDTNLNQAFQDQYAYRPTGSTTSAIVALVQNLSEMLKTEPYVRLISLDFSHAFDTVRHSYLAEQLATLPLPDSIYNWILALLSNQKHCTKYQEKLFLLDAINASIIQGSGMGPSNFVTVISGLKTIHKRNLLMKYADDSYVLIPASVIQTTSEELENIETWAKSSNLRLNAAKTKELIITLPGKKPLLPPPYPGLERVAEARVLGVVLSSSLGFRSHFTNICTRALQSLYAIRILTSHGLEGQRLHDVIQSTTLARLLYASPAWYGFLNAESRNRLNSIIKKLKRRRYLPVNYPSFEDLCDRADGKLFSSVY